jgi:uncharacterized protein
MKIRSITYFCNPGYPLREQVLEKAGAFIEEAAAAYEAAGYEVQTTRVATVPFPELLGEQYLSQLSEVTRQFTTLGQQLGIRYLSLGPALPEFPRSYEAIPEAIAASPDIFFGGVMADKTRGIDLAAIHACAEIIVQCARIEPNGFANLQFAALANVNPGAPFLPAAYHGRAEPAFAIATESADLAVQAFESARTLDEGRNALTSEITNHGQTLSQIARSLRKGSSLQPPRFLGIDFSLAPFPDDAQSLGNAVEKIGVPGIGLHGSLAAAALLTEAIDRADFPHTGFCGFMQPVLEDAVFARRAAEGTLTVKDMLLYSAVCGTGLDTIPLPGDTTAEQIVPLLLDICALALRLDKPLTARLMPIPGREVGDEIDFDFAYFAPSRVMALDSQGLTRAFAGTGAFHLSSRT